MPMLRTRSVWRYAVVSLALVGCHAEPEEAVSSTGSAVITVRPQPLGAAHSGSPLLVDPPPTVSAPREPALHDALLRAEAAKAEPLSTSVARFKTFAKGPIAVLVAEADGASKQVGAGW